MLVNDDGTILLLGTSTFSNDIGQVYLVKVDARGDIIWERFYFSTRSTKAIDIEVIADGNYVILCNVDDPLTGSNIQIITIDPSGNPIGSGEFTNVGLSNEIGITVTPIIDGGSPAGFIVAGHTNYDPIPNDNSDNGYEKITALFFRFNTDCSAYTGVWSDHQSSNGEDYATKVIQVSDLNSDDPFVLFGYTNSDPNNPSFNFWSTRINKYGGGLLLENGIIPGSPSTTEEKLGSVGITNQSALTNNYLLTGISTNNTGADNIFVATNQLGVLSPRSITEIDLGNIAGSGDRILEKVTSHPVKGGFVIAANTVIEGNANIVLIKISIDGERLLWNNPVILGGPGQDYESSVHVTSEGKILIFGSMSIGDDVQEKMMLIKLNEDGQFK
jgi:hypothetical protein